MSLYRPQPSDPALLPQIGGNNPVHIQNSTINSVAGNMNVSHTTNVGESGMDILRRELCVDAMHDSAVRPPDPSCHPGTRNAILERLDEWSFDQPEDSAIFWLHGCAGIGKSAIAQQFAASCQARGQLGGSFFWRRTDARRGDWRSLFPTLAYQLAASFPAIGPMMQRVVEIDKLVTSKSMRHQLQKLIVLPLREAPKLKSRPILVLDGLDECEDRAAQTMLLRSFIDAVGTEHTPIHILICSRSESHLREILESSENSDVCRGFPIHPDASAYADISRYLTDEFARIQRAHTSRGIALHDDWPGEAVIEQLVERSSGTFIYVSTIVRYVDDEYSHPMDRLEAVLRLDPSSTTPLDDLYTQILSVIPNRAMLVRVLHAIVYKIYLDPEQIDIVLQLRRGTSRITLRGLHSLLHVPSVRILDPEIWPVRLLHASFRDFLVDPQRSLGFCVSGEELRIALVHSMARALESGLRPSDFRTITRLFLRSFVDIPPTETLFPILRDVNVQHHAYARGTPTEVDNIRTWLQVNFVFLKVAKAELLQRYSPRPSDLIETWANLCYLKNSEITSFEELRWQNQHPSDETLTKVLLDDPALMSFVRITSVLAIPPDMYLFDAMVLDVLGLTWDALQPHLKLSFEDLRNFLRDPERCGALYVSQEETLRFIAVCCISRMTAILCADNCFFQFEPKWIRALCGCKPDEVVLGALEHLDLSQCCEKLAPDEEYHLSCHSDFLGPKAFAQIVDWLRKWPSTPAHIIQSWERQKAAVQECYADLMETADSESVEDLSSAE
ncbi:hypothetical protein FB45DRAFT_1056432 [Roridomyces roridus]|uniref:Nephrocystin 3-like N-terminal domain-containing protein n=1 Tax=Roridomyces roridus TaxID=1738132 RepID=A0AAD7FRH1_9AGAR|nr:hypothetical protein FB45DRAFT_1056432 [Roridomyces roridus]